MGRRVNNSQGEGRNLKFALYALTFSGDECLLWPYGKSSGYGSFSLYGAPVAAHVFVCEKTHGVAPQGCEAAHDCGNRACVNPRHIRWDTRSGNHADKHKHGTAQNGETHPFAKLTERDVLAIRASSLSRAELARQYGVTWHAVDNAIKRRSWWRV